MAYYDIFNGDADGICALHQLRLQHPIDSTLITGLKRDINLLDQVIPEKGDQLTVLDISLDKNRAGVERVIEMGAELFYADHHFAGDAPL
ncbi:MAG: DHH family phosphoesterase, partial [Gammaproteobacteria bacterium]|nr:DHH family phosphoesterase [Gammaproteobacteria bacterium]